MDTNCTKYLVEHVSEHFDSAEHIFDPLFKFVLEHQSFFSSTPTFTGDSFATLTKLHSVSPSDDISKCPSSSLLTWRADLALQYICSEFEKNQYPASTFLQYLAEPENAEAILKSGMSEKPSGACLAAFIFKSPLPEHAALKSRIGSELFSTLSKSKPSEFIDILASSVPQQLEGPENEFIKSLNNISMISKTWDHMKVADLSPKVKLAAVSNKLSDKEFFELYGGNYSLVPKSEPDANFDKLTESEQNSICVNKNAPKYVKSFLIANFPKFHSLLNQNAMTVYNQLKTANLNNFNAETKKYSSKLSYYSSDSATLNNMFKSIQHISEKYNVSYLSDVVDAIVHSYLPSLKRFKSSRVFNNSLASVMVSTGNNSLLLGAAVYLQEPSELSVPSPLPSPQPTETETKSINNLYCGSLTGGEDSKPSFTNPDANNQDSLTTKHFNTLVQIQKKFNAKFITEYRKLLDILVNVPDTEFKSYELPILQEMIGQFNKILIRDGKTAIKLTGVKEKHLNKEYSLTCEGLINVLNNRHFDALMPIVPILQNIINLLKEVLDEAVKERDAYFFAKKTPIDFDTYENLTTKLENEYIHFSKEDSVKMTDIVSRFRDFLSSKVIPKGDETTYSRLKEYINKLSNRNDAINRYFDDMTENIKYHQSQQYSTSSSKILNPIVNLAITLINEHKKAYIWLNEKIDAFEVNDRIKQLRNRTFTEQELEKIANAYVEFNKYIKLNANKLGNKYKHFMLYEPKNVCNFFKCYQLARETIEEIGSINYLERLYKILNIVDTSSEEWAQFKIGLTNYLALSTIWFDIYKMKFENPGDNQYKVWTEFEKDKAAEEDQELAKLNDYIELKRGRTYKLFKSLNDILTCSDDQIFGNIFVDGITETDLKGAIKNNQLKNDEWKYHKKFTEYGTALLQLIENKTIYNPRYIVGFSMKQKKNFNPINENKNGEFYSVVLKSLYVPVLQQLEKYIRVRYTGALDLNTNINKLMMGGSSENSENSENTKQKAGSLYDYTDQHFDEPQKVIPEAFKFYICGYAIIKYYFQKLEEIRNNEGKTTMTIEFNERSNFSSLREKTNDDKEIKLIIISANEYNMKLFLKVMNKYWSAAVGDTETKTTKAIEMICAEFNNLIVFGDINDLRRIRDGTDHEIDLDKQYRNYNKIHNDMEKFINEASNLIVSAGINYDILLKKELGKAIKEMNASNDKFGTLRKWIENVDKPKEIESEERRLFIDVFLTPIIVINSYWASYLGSVVYLPNFMKNDTETTERALINMFSRKELKPFISSLLKYGKHSTKTVGDIIKLSLQEYYEDMDSAIHHILGYKGFTEQSVKLLANEIHNKFKDTYEQIMKFFNSTEFSRVSASKLLTYITVSVPQFDYDYIQHNIFKKGVFYNDSYIKFQIDAFDDVKTFTQFVCVALARLSPHKYLPQSFVDGLKQSELLNNTFSEIRSMGVNTLRLFGCREYKDPKENNINPKEIIYNEEIIDVITSSLIYWSSSQLAMETDSKVANQTYKNKIVTTIPILLYILDTIYKRIDEHHEEYWISTGTSYYKLKAKNEEENENKNKYFGETVNRDQLQPLTNQKSRTIKINAKSEITILKNYLKALYAEFLPTATKITFMNSGSVQSDHYLCEVRKLVEENKITFKDVLENPEKFEWILPTAKIDAGVEYLECKRFERYLKLIEPITIDADFNKSFVTVIQLMAKVLVYGIIDSLDYSMNKIKNNSFMGGENSIEVNVLNPTTENKKLSEFVIPDLKEKLKNEGKLNNIEGNLIASVINNSLNKLHFKHNGVDVDKVKRGQLMTNNQQFALYLYNYFKGMIIDWKNFNIDLLIKSGILDSYDKLYECVEGEDGKINDVKVKDSIPNIRIGEELVVNDTKSISIDNSDYNFTLTDDGLIFNTSYSKSFGGDNTDINLEHAKEVISTIIRDIQYYTSETSYKEYLSFIQLLNEIGYTKEYCSFDFDIINNLSKYVKIDIDTDVKINIESLFDNEIYDESKKYFSMKQFKLIVNEVIRQLKLVPETYKTQADEKIEKLSKWLNCIRDNYV